MTQMCRAHEIKAGNCFLKKHGHYAYLRISDAAVKFYGLNNLAHIYGVCYNGNITKVEKSTLVVPVTPSAMAANREADKNWHKTIIG